MNKLSPEEYLEQNKIPEILEGIVLSLLEVRPNEVENHIINYLQNRINFLQPKPPVSAPERDPFPTFTKGSSNVQEFPMKSFNNNQIRRKSTISPACLTRNATLNRRPAMSSHMNSNTDVELRFIQKDPKIISEIDDIICSIDLFSFLQPDQRKTLIGAMFIKNFQAGEQIIMQGDFPDNFYIIREGRCMIKKHDKEGKITFQTTIGEGRYFGELALITGATRAASVYAETDVSTWAVDQSTYRVLLKTQHVQKRCRYKTILKQVPLLADLEDYQILLIADALHQMNPKEGEIIVKEGDVGDTFYIILEGECTVSINGKVVNKLERNQYFGELALMNEVPRAATVTAGNGVELVTLDRLSFRRLLPMCSRIFQENMKKYKNDESKSQKSV